MFCDVTAEWERHLEGLLDNIREGQSAETAVEVAVDPDLKAHFDRAHDLLGQMRRKAPLEDLEEKIANMAGFAILARANGRVRSLSKSVGPTLGSLRCLDELQHHLTAHGGSRLEELLHAAQQGDTEGTAVVLATDFRPRHLLARVTACAETAGQVMIEGLDYHWSDQAGAMLVSSFGLSRAEVEIVRGVMTGRSLREIAVQSGRSEHTVRNQMKSVLSKTGAPGQADLIRLVALLIDKNPSKSQTNSGLGNLQEDILDMRSGLRMQLYQCGDPDGTPVLFLHGMLDGVAALKVLDNQFRQQGWRVIAPMRPGYGLSDPVADKTHALETVVSHIEELLVKLYLNRPVVLGHMAGAVLGHILCSRPALSLKGMVAVSAAGPMLTRRQYARMAPRQRAMAYTARFAPGLLPFFVRAGVSLLQSEKSESFIDALYPPGTHERQVIDRLELSDAMLRGYRSSAQAGASGFIQDGLLMVRDWVADMGGNRPPVIHLHGVLDPVLAVAEAQEFAERFEHIELRRFKDAGQFLLYEKPHAVLDALVEVQAG